MAQLEPSITFSVQVISTIAGTPPPDNDTIANWFQKFANYLSKEVPEFSISRDLTIHNRGITCTVITPRTIADIDALCWGKELLNIIGINTEDISFLNIGDT